MSEDKLLLITFNSSISREVGDEGTREVFEIGHTWAVICDWACLCWLAGRVGRHRIMLILREKERRLAWSLNRVSGPAVQRKRHVAPRPAAAPGTGVKWDANPCTNADVGDQVQLRQPCCYYGIRYRDGMDDCKLMISSRKIKTQVENVFNVSQPKRKPRVFEIH